MRHIKKIPLFIFIYTYTFSKILLSHQADGDVHRMVKRIDFAISGRNTLDLQKCPENTVFTYFHAFGVCNKNINFLNEKTEIWTMTEHVTPEGGDNEKSLEESANPFIRAYYSYCKEAHSKKQKCSLYINKAEEGGDRFRTDIGLDCENRGQSTFNGTYFCIEKTGSPVQEGEVVTLVGFKGRDIEPRCPEDRKISIITAFEIFNPLGNKGLINSFYEEASKKCNGHEKCTIATTDESKFKKFRLFTYKCVEG